MDYALFGIISMVGWLIPIGIIVVIVVWLIQRRKHQKQRNIQNDPQWYLQPILNTEDGISQGLILISYCLIPALLNYGNRLLTEPFEWQIVVIIWAIIGLALAIYHKNLFVHLLSIIALFVGIVGQLTSWSVPEGSYFSGNFAWIVPFTLWWPIAVYTIGTLFLQKRPLQRFYITHQVLGSLTLIGIIYLLSTQIGFELIRYLRKTAIPIESFLYVSLILVLLAGITVGSLMIALIQKTIHKYEAITLSICAAIGLGLLFMLNSPADIPSTNSNNYRTYPTYASDVYNPYDFLWSIILNLLALLLPVALLMTGIYRKEHWRVNTGIIALFIICVIKYFDWFFSFMDKSLFFILAGILLLGLGYGLERTRRYVVSATLKT